MSEFHMSVHARDRSLSQRDKERDNADTKQQLFMKALSITFPYQSMRQRLNKKQREKSEAGKRHKKKSITNDRCCTSKEALMPDKRQTTMRKHFNRSTGIKARA